MIFMNLVTTKKEEKKTEEEPKKKSFVKLLDEDQVEIKKLDPEDSEDALKVMRKCSFDVTQGEIETILRYGFSYGCYVNRMLIGVGLAWSAHLDVETKTVKSGSSNALYLEDPAVLLAYEGRGIRRILLKAREDAAQSKLMKFSIAYLYEDVPKGEIVSLIKEAGSQLEKLYLSESYSFFKTEKGILAFKQLTSMA